MASSEKWKILLVEDDERGREAMKEWLERDGFEVIAVPDGRSAQRHLYDGIAVLLTDLKLPGSDGLELLRLAKQQAPHTAVIFVTGHATVDSAVRALKEGATDYITKPVNPGELTHRLRQAIEMQSMASQLATLHSKLSTYRFENIVGQSQAMLQVFEKVRLAADARSTVLIIGENGTGKELVASALHQNSPRRNKPFIPVNCAAIPETLVESELFGHEKGAFTGATEKRAGLFQSAHGGTLFLDEIGELRLGTQSKVLRAIETHRVMPVGGRQEIEVDVRLITATNRDLVEEIKAGRFRDDLYYRLKVVEIVIPPLRERKEDIPLLVRHFLDQIAKDNNRPVKDISQEAMNALLAYEWPGNVRELRNTLEGIVILSTRPRIELDDLPEHIRGSSSRTDMIRPGMTLQELEREAIRRALGEYKGKRTDTAKALGISVRTLQRKIQEYGL